MSDGGVPGVLPPRTRPRELLAPSILLVLFLSIGLFLEVQTLVHRTSQGAHASVIDTSDNDDGEGLPNAGQRDAMAIGAWLFVLDVGVATWFVFVARGQVDRERSGRAWCLAPPGVLSVALLFPGGGQLLFGWSSPYRMLDVGETFIILWGVTELAVGLLLLQMAHAVRALFPAIAAAPRRLAGAFTAVGAVWLALVPAAVALYPNAETIWTGHIVSWAWLGLGVVIQCTVLGIAAAVLVRGVPRRGQNGDLVVIPAFGAEPDSTVLQQPVPQLAGPDSRSWRRPVAGLLIFAGVLATLAPLFDDAIFVRSDEIASARSGLILMWLIVVLAIAVIARWALIPWRQGPEWPYRTTKRFTAAIGVIAAAGIFAIFPVTTWAVSIGGGWGPRWVGESALALVVAIALVGVVLRYGADHPWRDRAIGAIGIGFLLRVFHSGASAILYGEHVSTGSATADLVVLWLAIAGLGGGVSYWLFLRVPARADTEAARRLTFGGVLAVTLILGTLIAASTGSAEVSGGDSFVRASGALNGSTSPQFDCAPLTDLARQGETVVAVMELGGEDVTLTAIPRPNFGMTLRLGDPDHPGSDEVFVLGTHKADYGYGSETGASVNEYGVGLRDARFTSVDHPDRQIRLDGDIPC